VNGGNVCAELSKNYVFHFEIFISNVLWRCSKYAIIVVAIPHNYETTDYFDHDFSIIGAHLECEHK
jgi:hypothetical protein